MPGFLSRHRAAPDVEGWVIATLSVSAVNEGVETRMTLGKGGSGGGGRKETWDDVENKRTATRERDTHSGRRTVSRTRY